MLVHSVYFWLKPSLTADQENEFRQGLESLRGIPSVTALYIGVPADTNPRPVIDTSYSFGLVVLLDGLDDHDAYQADPLHKAFLEQFAGYWEKVTIYDTEE